MSKTDNQSQVDVDKIIHQLYYSKGTDVKLQPYEIRQICIKARDIFIQEPMLLTIKAPIKICGDVHGQYKDLLRIFNSGGHPSKQQYLFMGDYVDRGKNSLQCIILLFCFKIKYPTTFFMLRGNHQCSYINRLYGFYDQCKRRSNLKVFKLFTDVFNVLPVAAVINKRIICMHGGLSPQITRMEQINNIERPTQIPQTGPLCDLLWSDPHKEIQGWQDNLQRGVSYTFGVDVIQNFLKQNDLDVVCRAHQVLEQGFQFIGNRKLVTIFSAPNYCGMFDNDGAFMNVDQRLVCSFKQQGKLGFPSFESSLQRIKAKSFDELVQVKNIQMIIKTSQTTSQSHLTAWQEQLKQSAKLITMISQNYLNDQITYFYYSYCLIQPSQLHIYQFIISCHILASSNKFCIQTNNWT